MYVRRSGRVMDNTEATVDNDECEWADKRIDVSYESEELSIGDISEHATILINGGRDWLTAEASLTRSTYTYCINHA